MQSLPEDAIYFDNNATTHIDPIIAERMNELNIEGVFNPASQHLLGRRALHLLEESKTTLLELVGAPCLRSDAAQVILTSGGTEANNLAVFGLFSKRPGITIVGATDHPSIIEAARHAAGTPERFRVLPVTDDGLCDLQILESWLHDIYAAGTDQVSFVSVMLGNNETGVVQDIKSICAICAKYDVPVHSDVVQAIGKIPFNMTDMGLSAITLTGHKIHGPVGIGALILNHNVPIDAVIVGGGQQLGLRAGTEPVVPAVGLALALQLSCTALDAGVFNLIATLRDRFEELLLSTTDIVVIASQAPRLPHVSNIAFLGLDRQALQMSLDLKSIYCSTGSACSSGSSRPSGTLVAMGLPEEIVLSSLRFSFSRFSTDDEVDLAIGVIAKVIDRCHLSST